MTRKDRRERATELLEAFSLHRQAPRAHALPVRRHEAPADPRPRADAPPEAADPRRADRRRGRGAAAGAVALRAADQRGEGTTILLTTHYLEEAEQLCNKIAFINGGEIVATGTSGDLAREYDVSQPGRRVPRARRPRRALARPRPGDRRMSPAQIRFLTLVRRETTRFFKIKRQTLGAPLLETFLYISVFGAALGSAHRQAARRRLRRLHHPRADHDGLGDERLLATTRPRCCSRSSSARSTTSCPRRPRRWSCCSRSRSAVSCAG